LVWRAGGRRALEGSKVTLRRRGGISALLLGLLLHGLWPPCSPSRRLFASGSGRASDSEGGPLASPSPHPPRLLASLPSLPPAPQQPACPPVCAGTARQGPTQKACFASAVCTGCRRGGGMQEEPPPVAHHHQPIARPPAWAPRRGPPPKGRDGNPALEVFPLR